MLGSPGSGTSFHTSCEVLPISGLVLMLHVGISRFRDWFSCCMWGSHCFGTSFHTSCEVLPIPGLALMLHVGFSRSPADVWGCFWKGNAACQQQLCTKIRLSTFLNDLPAEEVNHYLSKYLYALRVKNNYFFLKKQNVELFFLVLLCNSCFLYYYTVFLFITPYTSVFPLWNTVSFLNLLL